MLTVRSSRQNRVFNVLEESIEKIDNDFNLTNVIIDYKERQKEKILVKMKSKFYALFIANPRRKG